ncbi:hypothetical protein ACET3X_000424 [Alternaria dauci]|uniref:Uncharacterized protein n=1 Tax=Alternaria dauci TaxID=48095 RepID=A0ABR3UUX2_9PLEO
MDDPDTPNLIIRDRIRTAHNLFGTYVVEVKLDGASHFASSRALNKWCGAYSERSSANDEEYKVVDFGRRRISPVIARAFFQAISPFPRNELPTHDIIPDPDLSLAHEDVALVILPDNPKPRKIDWNFDACAKMYKLATALKSPVVKDMVADRILKNYLEYCEEAEEDEDDKPSLKFPVKFANSLTVKNDLPILRLLVDIALDQIRRGHNPPSRLATQVKRLLDDRSSEQEGKTQMLHDQSPTTVCAEYHGRGRPCHTAYDARYTTEQLIHDIFQRIKIDTCREALEALEMEDNQDTDDDSPKNALDRYELLLWSREMEEKVPLFMLEYERLATKLNGIWARDEEADSEDEKRAEWLVEKITALRVEHNERWLDFGEEEDEEPGHYAEQLFDGC